MNIFISNKYHFLNNYIKTKKNKKQFKKFNYFMIFKKKTYFSKKNKKNLQKENSTKA
jgi:hypothetical protein